jgi:TP901 family phage tail tape measure protein
MADLSMQISIGAALAGSFAGAFSKAGNTIAVLEQNIKTLSKEQEKIAQYKGLKNSIAATSLEYKQAQADVAAYAKKVEEARDRVKQRDDKGRFRASDTESLTELSKNLEQASSKSKKLRTQFMNQATQLRELRGEMGKAGLTTKNLASEQARLAEKSAKLTQAQERLAKSQAAADTSRQTLASAKGDIMASAGWLLAMKQPIQTAASFEQAIAKVGAVSGATSEDMARLTEQARILGRDTQFTATQTANSQEMLARAGFKTEEIIKTMPGLLNMAAAEGMDLATAADIAASTLRGFQLAADQSGRVSDVLAKASAASNTSISTLGESMKMIAPIAAGLKIPFEETSAMIGVMGDAGIKGSEAGTALRAALIRLSKEPKQTEQALSDLGVATRDASGNLRTMPSLMAALSKQMANMGEADKMSNLAKIFGTEAASGMLAVMNAADSGRLQELTETLNNAGGAAAEMAAKMNDTAQGAMKRLGSAWESLNIDVGNAILPAFSASVEKLAGAIGWLSEKAQDFPIITSAITGFFVAVGSYKVAATAGRVLKAAFMLPFQDIAVGVNKFRAALALADGSVLKMIKNTKLAKAATKAWAAAQWLLSTALTAAQWLLNAGKLVAYKAAQFAIAAASKAWAAAQWLLNAALSANPIGLVIIAIAALAGALIWAYKKCDWFREKWDNLVAIFKNSPIGNLIAAIKEKFTAGFEAITGVIEKVSGMWDKFKSALGIAPKIPVPEGQVIAAGPNGNGIVMHAAGGIFNRPHLGLVAERGTTESIIPHNPGGEHIWRATGEMAGFSSGVSGGEGTVFSPTIHINVTASPGSNGNEIGRQIMEAVERELPRLLRRCEEQRLRVAY